MVFHSKSGDVYNNYKLNYLNCPNEHSERMTRLVLWVQLKEVHLKCILFAILLTLRGFS